MVAACVAITDCITSLPSASSTAAEMVLWWTSRPIYLMLSIGCSFRQAWFTASHSNQILLRKGRPFIMRGPHIRAFCECVGIRTVGRDGPELKIYGTLLFDEETVGWGTRHEVCFEYKTITAL